MFRVEGNFKTNLVKDNADVLNYFSLLKYSLAIFTKVILKLLSKKINKIVISVALICGLYSFISQQP